MNDSMGYYIAENIKEKILAHDLSLENSNVLIKGLTFKENVNDIRNSKVMDIIKYLKKENINVYLEDKHVNNFELKKMYNYSLSNNIPKVDVVVFAVKHKEYYNMNIEDLNNLYDNKYKIVFDIHGIFNKNELLERGFEVWRL